MPWVKRLGGNLTDAQVAILGPTAELANDPLALGYAPFITGMDVDNLILLLTFIRDGVTPCPVNNVVGNANPITAATLANPTVVTSANHGLANGKAIVIAGDARGSTGINGTWLVSGVTTNTFTISLDTSASGAYSGSGAYWLPAVKNLSVVTQQILGSIKPADVNATALSTNEQLIVSSLMNDGAIALSDPATGLDNNNVKHIRKLVTSGSASDLALTALENRLGGRIEVLVGSGIVPNETDIHNALQK